jgi:serine/threonine-protein kinase
VADPKDRETGPEAVGDASPIDTATDDPGSGHASNIRIGVYQVLDLLGAGGMGDVFLAFDARLHRRVAIKRIRSDAPVTARARERLRREAAAVAALSHAAIVHVYDILTDDSGDAIVMEFVEGEPLSAALSRGPLPLAQAIDVGRQVAEGLAAAHAAGLIHRDLKSRNVMLTPSGQVKILDFGLAKRLRQTPGEDTLTAEGSLLGTVSSMSPEQAQGLPLDARSDLFSLGILLYELSTGRPPFRGESPAQTLLKLMAEPHPSIAERVPDIPPSLATLIDELLEKAPERRPATATEVATRLGEIAQLAPLKGPRPSDARLAGAPAATAAPRRALAAVGVLLLLAAAFGGYRLLRRGRATPAVAVLVIEPVLPPNGADERPRLAVFAVRESIVRALTGLDGIEPVTADDVAADALTLPQRARAAGADEMVVPAVDCAGASCRVSLRRQRARDAHVLGNSKPFDVSSEPEEALALASAVAIHVRTSSPTTALARRAASSSCAAPTSSAISRSGGARRPVRC